MADFILRMRERISLRRRVQTACQVVADERFRFLGDQVVDLSLCGLLVRSEEYARLGEPVYLSLQIPGGTSWIDATGHVARIIHGHRVGDPGRCVGISFDELEPSYFALLHASLTRLPIPEPARRIRRDYASTIQLIARSHRRFSPLRPAGLRF